MVGVWLGRINPHHVTLARPVRSNVRLLGPFHELSLSLVALIWSGILGRIPLHVSVFFSNTPWLTFVPPTLGARSICICLCIYATYVCVCVRICIYYCKYLYLESVHKGYRTQFQARLRRLDQEPADSAARAPSAPDSPLPRSRWPNPLDSRPRQARKALAVTTAILE